MLGSWVVSTAALQLSFSSAAHDAIELKQKKIAIYSTIGAIKARKYLVHQTFQEHARQPAYYHRPLS